MAKGAVLRYIFLGLFFLGLVSFPLLGNAYYVNVMVFVAINTILAVGLNLLMGYAGQVSLGHAAFYGLGAYSSGILTAKYGISPWIALLIALIVTAGIAYLVGVPTLRLKGHYLAMATLGFGMIIYVLLNEMDPLTGGPSGLVNIPGLSLASFKLDSDVKYYYFVWSITVFILILSSNLVNSRIGRALRAIHFSEVAANAMGVDITKYKLKVFILSAAYASLAGTLYAHYVKFISPSSFSFTFSVELVTMVVVGGLASVWGSAFGAATLTILPEVLRALKDYDIIIYGLILMLVMIFMPKGLTWGVWNLIKGRR